MCGIAGYSGTFGPDLLHRMSSVIAHRGPDDEGIFSSPQDGIGLAHRRLTIIDLSARGHQPMWDATRSVVIVFNGEIYNYRQLRSELGSQGYVFNNNSDTEVLLNLYLRSGERMLQELDGIFAFALWDTRDHSLFVARDGCGVKPLYYSASRGGFLFGSELKAILQEESIDRGISSRAIQSYLTYLYSPSPDTMFRSIKKLEPGHALLVRDGRIIRGWEFYDLPYNQPIEAMSEHEAVDRVRTGVRDAVGRQMVADVPVGCFLSGGLDSSSIVSFAREFTDTQLQCFTITFGDSTLQSEGLTDDVQYAKRVAKELEVDLRMVEVTSNIADDFAYAVYHLEEPQADPAALNTFYISRLARQEGIKVLLSGTGGDDIFTGYRRHRALQYERLWSWLPASLRLLIRQASSHVPPSSAFARRFSKAFRYSDFDGDARIASYFNWIDPELLQGLYGPRMLDDANDLASHNPLTRALEKLPQTVPDLNRMLYLDGKFFLADHNLNYTDKMGMAAGVEVRVPLLDKTLVQLASRLPLEYKQHGSIGKWVFKRAMEGILPTQVIYRPKTGFAVPLRKWLRNDLRELLEDTLSERAVTDRGLFDFNAVQTLISRDRQGIVDAAYPILGLLFIELWMKVFVDRSVVPMPTVNALGVS